MYKFAVFACMHPAWYDDLYALGSDIKQHLASYYNIVSLPLCCTPTSRWCGIISVTCRVGRQNGRAATGGADASSVLLDGPPGRGSR